MTPPTLPQELIEYTLTLALQDDFPATLEGDREALDSYKRTVIEVAAVNSANATCIVRVLSQQHRLAELRLRVALSKYDRHIIKGMMKCSHGPLDSSSCEICIKESAVIAALRPLVPFLAYKMERLQHVSAGREIHRGRVCTLGTSGDELELLELLVNHAPVYHASLASKISFWKAQRSTARLTPPP